MPASGLVGEDLNWRRGAFGGLVEYEACEQEAFGEEVYTERMKKTMDRSTSSSTAGIVLTSAKGKR